jgi:chromosome segregation protein
MPSRLKSLELHGYKTFASRTLFEFAGAITAVVGPNGSGKSNIADALRWVLGEQSFSLLRGKKTEDMIFSGSEQRARAGMASATIVFDNSDGWLPIDFSEVAITRRAYRDGDNEYLLNGQRVRLRDVSELLAQSGLSERTYTVIGQGLVDAALALKAEERRRLFEEAAGIGLHRSRREEALRRLETTRRNLERVQDILAELQPRLRSLERQSRRTQEYEQVKADLRVLLREWYGYHWHTTQAELTHAREAARQQETALEAARNTQAVMDERISASRLVIQDLRLDLSELHRRSAGLHSRRESLSRDLAVSAERLRSFEQQRHSSKEELARLQEESGLHQERFSAAEEEARRLESELAEARLQAEVARKDVQARMAERSRVEKQVQSARQALGALTARQSHLQARLSERQTQAGRQAEALKAAQLALSQAEAELSRQQAQLEKTTGALKDAVDARSQSEEALQEKRQEQALLEAERKELQERRSTYGAEFARLRARIEVLEQAEQALAGYAGGARLLIEASRQERLKGSRGALSSFLEVPAELETAIAAALGEFVDAVLLDGASAADSALDLLQGAAARAALLPLGTLKPPPSPPIRGEDVLGAASALIDAPADLKPALEMLLGQVWVVKDREAARRILPSLTPGARAVTLSGEVFYAGGVIVAGSDKKPGLLSRPRQRRELQEALEEVERTAAGLDLQIADSTRQMDALRRELERMGQEASTARRREEAARSAHSQVELSAEKAHRQAQWQRDQSQRLLSEQEQGRAETARLSAELEPLEKEIERARQVLREHNAVLNGLSLDEFQTQLAHWNTRAAVAERSSQEALSRQREQQAAIDRSQRLAASLQQRLDDLEASAKKLESDKTALREQEASLTVEIEALREQTEPKEAHLEEAEKRQSELQTEEAASRQALSLAEHYHAQARINLARRQEALDSLRRRIEDDLGLVAFEYADEISGPTPLPLDGMVEQLPQISRLAADIEETIKRQRGQLRRMGPINPEAQAEFIEVRERYTFLKEQVSDLHKAEGDVKAVIAELNVLMQREFRKTFDAVAQEFRIIFTRLFGGGSARLVMTDPEDLNQTGIDIEARLPGRKPQGLSLLSGGERSLTAAALVFSLLKVSPTPFCVLDEVDAMLDEANVGRFRELLRELSRETQFVIITHNRNTVQAADVLYGVTMGRDSASQVISLKLDELSTVVE